VLYAQILDDTTSNVYGPETTRFIYEENFRYNDGGFQTVDTLIEDFHNWTYVERNDNKFQNLGVVGTAMFPIYFSPPEKIGARMGFNAYDPFFESPGSFRFYDTKSPFIDLKIYLGGNVRSVVDVDIARNITPNWSVGFDFTNMDIDKQFGAMSSRGDRLVESTGYNFNTRFHSNDSAYHLLAAFSRIRHQVFETGGIIAEDTSTREELFDVLFDDDAEIWLRNAVSRDLRQFYHVYHQYNLSKLAQLYHIFDHNKQFNTFADAPLGEDAAFFQQFLVDPDSTRSLNRFREIQNEVGIKGDVGAVFYNIFYRRRTIKFLPPFTRPRGPFSENYGGLNLRYDLRGNEHIGIGGEFQQGGNFKVKGFFSNKYLDVIASRTQYEPSFLAKAYFDNHNEWENDFQSPTADEIKVEGKLQLGIGKISPFASLTRVDNHIFYDREVLPSQADGEAEIFSAGLSSRLKFFRILRLNSEIIYTNVSGAEEDIFRIPELFFNGQLYYENDPFGGNIQIQAGLDFHVKSSYFANAYDPVIQQFFLQDELEIPSFVLVDLFLNFKILRTFVFLKVININEGFQADGFLTTPYYRGQFTTFDVGIRWLFFD